MVSLGDKRGRSYGGLIQHAHKTILVMSDKLFRGRGNLRGRGGEGIWRGAGVNELEG